MVYLLMTLIFLSAAVGAFLLGAPTDAQVALWRRAREFRHHTEDPNRLEDELMSRSFYQRVIQPGVSRVALSLGRLAPSGVTERARIRLQQAGRPMELPLFVGMKMLFSLTAGGTGLILTGAWGAGSFAVREAILVLTVCVLGWQLPDFWLSRSIERRRTQLEKALPDVLDVLSISVEAGLGLDGAIQKVAEKFTDPTSTEFRGYLKEVRLGKPRAEALRDLAARSSVADMKSFAAAVIQAEQLGASLAKVLRVQSDQMRQKRKQRAEEQAAKAPVKMLLPLVFFIFPSIFVVILGPAALMLIESFGGR